MSEGSGAESGAYEAELLEVFGRCDGGGHGYLDSEGLAQLCRLLNLEDKSGLMAHLGETTPVSFASFKQALLSLLSSSDSNRTNSPEREVSPKYVYGQKKYGRRSRPESTECEDGDTLTLPAPNSLQRDTSCHIDIEAPLLLSQDDTADPEEEERRYESLSEGRPRRGERGNLHQPEPHDTPEKDIERGCSELREVWHRMGGESGGFLDKSQLAMVCSSVGMDTLADQVVEQVFLKLGRRHDERVGLDEFLELVRSWSPPSSPPPSSSSPLYLSPSHNSRLIKSNDVEAVLWDNGVAGSAKMVQELQAARALVEAVSKERDKLRSDLADANQRASLLAQEVDERHARIETTAHNRIKELELKYNEEMREMEREASLEREALSCANAKLEETLSRHVDQIGKLDSELGALRSDLADLDKENRALRERLAHSDAARLQLDSQIKYYQSLHARMVELERVDESLEKMKERISSLQSENTELRDRNDELTSQLEAAITATSGKPLHRREGSWACGDWCNGVGGGGTKRRGKSPDWADTKLGRHRLGKVRRCSTEVDLYSAASLQQHINTDEASLKKWEKSESGLETDLDTAAGSSPTLSSTSFENGGDCEETEMEKLRAYIANLEDRLSQYQLKEWSSSGIKSMLSCDEESLNFPSIITVKSEPDQNILCRTFGDASDIMSYKSASVNGINLRCEESVSAGVQTDVWTPSPEESVEMKTGMPASLNVGPPETSPLDPPSNFNDGVEWDSSETVVTPTRSPLRQSLSHRLRSGQNGLSELLPSGEPLIGEPDVEPDEKTFEELKVENRKLSERCKEFENSLELMRIEYEKTEDYWASKLDEERRLFEEDQMQSDEKFGELQMKIEEYAELFGGESSKRTALPPIEEKDYLEKQFTDLEEEYDNFRQKTEDELNEKDEEIMNLREAVATLKSHVLERKEVECQTEAWSALGIANCRCGCLSDSSEPSDPEDEEGGKEAAEEEQCVKCLNRLSRAMRSKRRLKCRLVLECQALQLHKRQLLHQISTLKTSSQVHLSNTQMWTALKSKLRYQESICQTLEHSFRLQQKRTEQALHKAYERHKFDLLNVQNTLRMTREKLQNQSAITRQLLERVAEADTLVKELFVENAHLVSEIASLQSDSPERIGPLSI